MKTQSIGLTVAFCFLAGAVCFAADPHMGTWKLNPAKSKITPGTLIFYTIIYKSMFGKLKVTGEGIDADRKPVHTEWTGKFDGKDYPVVGDAISDSRSYTKVDDRTLDLTVKKGGKTIDTVRMVLSADGKSRTVTLVEPGRKEKSSRTSLFTTSNNSQACEIPAVTKSIASTGFGVTAFRYSSSPCSPLPPRSRSALWHAYPVVDHYRKSQISSLCLLIFHRI